jgi:serine/threonine protein kinase
VKDSPPQPLVDLLSSLDLAGPDEVCAVASRVRRLAGGLPLFESLWLDALAQTRVITTWQAVEIDGGRGPALQVGPFLLYERLLTLGYVNLYRARESEGGGFMRLAIAADGIEPLDAQPRLASLALKADELTTPLSPIVRHGLDGKRLWMASAWLTGRTARQWMLGHGRFPPATVREIARQTLQGLLACERAGVVHADLGLDQLWFDGRGEVRLPEPGLRAALRPQESGQPELPAEAYDYLSPERATSGAVCETRDDVWACGALWWHMLTGRPPFAGATPAAKLHTLRTAKLPDIRQIVPETPGPFAELLMRCLSRAPAERPDSLAAVAAALGESKPRSQRRLAKALRPRASPRGW